MTDQVEVQEVTQDEDQAFEAAFADVRGEEPPTEPETVTEEPKVQEPEEDPKQEFVTEQPQEQIDPVSELRSEIESLKKSLHDNTQKIHGKMGEAFRTLQNLQQQKQTVGVELTIDDLDEELREQFPEMAELQLKSLQKVLGKALGGVKPVESQQAPAFDPNIIDQRITQVASEVETRVQRQYEEKFLEMRHPDFRDVIQSDQFQKWTQMQPPQVQEQILNSVDSSFASRALDAFKQWRTSGEKRSQQKTNRLEAAVVPKGVSPQPAIQDEDTALMQEFQKRRARVIT